LKCGDRSKPGCCLTRLLINLEVHNVRLRRESLLLLRRTPRGARRRHRTSERCEDSREPRTPSRTASRRLTPARSRHLDAPGLTRPGTRPPAPCQSACSADSLATRSRGPPVSSPLPRPPCLPKHATNGYPPSDQGRGEDSVALKPLDPRLIRFEYPGARRSSPFAQAVHTAVFVECTRAPGHR